MKKNNKKGFTLIELLAVLVVLAILALIAIPIVIKVINNAREDSYKRSIEGYARAVEMGLARYAMAHPGEAFPETLSGIIDEDKKTLIDYKGDQVYCNDGIEVTDKGEVNLFECYTEKSGDKKKWDYIKGVVKDAKGSTQPSVTYSVGDLIKFNNENYHVIDVPINDDTYVVALKDEPLTYDKVVELKNSTELKNDIRNENGYGGISYSATETCGYMNGSWGDTNCSNEYDLSSIKQILTVWSNGFSDKLKEVNGYRVRLISFEDLTINLGYVYTPNVTSMNLNSENTPNWVYNANYACWTMSPMNDSKFHVWYVTNGGNVSNVNVGEYSIYVVRPVINVLKSAITKN